MKLSRDRAGEGRTNEEFAANEDAAFIRATIDFGKLASKHKWLLVAGLVAGLMLGEAAYLKLGPAYLATTRVLVSKRTAGTQLKESNDSGSSGERGEHVALIMSPLIISEAVKTYQLDKLASLRGAQDPAQEILDSLQVKRTAGTDRSVLNVLDIAYVSRTPRDATKVVTAVTKAYGDYLLSAQREHTAETVALITKANHELHDQLREKEQAYIKFREQAPLHWRNAPGTVGQTSDTTNVHQERMLAIEADRRTILLRRTEIRSKLEAIEEAQSRGDSHEAMELLVRRFLNVGGAGVDPATSAEAVLLATMETRLLPLILEKKKLLRDFGPDHPDVMAVNKSIEATREFYRRQGLNLPDSEAAPGKSDTPTRQAPKKVDLVAAYIDSLRQELSELAIRERDLTGLSAAEAKAAKGFARCQMEDQTFNDEIQRLKTLWQLVVTRLNEVNMLKDNGGFTLKTMSPAREGLDIKRQYKIAGAGGVVGLLFAIGLMSLRALRDTTLKTIDDLQSVLGLSVIGRVPQIDFNAVSKPSRESLLDASLLYFHQPASPQAECYRSVRTALFVCTHSGGEKVIQVTSSEPQDGKTTLACNLAAAMAQSGKKVLLIDADLRCPKVFKMFGFKQEIGLSDVLAGEIELPNAIHATEVKGLSILGSGLSPVNPAEMLGSPRFQQMLRDVRSEFDFVLVDTPPLLAVSDPCIVAPSTDGLLFVVRLGKNSRAVAQRALDLLATHDINVLGVVANGVPPQEGYGEGYGYSSYTEPKSLPAPKSRRELEPV